MSASPPGASPAPTSPPSTNSTAPPPTTTTPPPAPATSTSPPPSATTSPPSPSTPAPSTSPPAPINAPPPVTPSSPSPPAPAAPSTPGSTPATRSPPVSSRSSPPPPPKTQSSTPTPSSSSSSSSVSSGLVIGVAIGGVVILVLITLVFICCRRKKRRDYGPPPNYYFPPTSAPPKDPYGGPQQQWQNNAPPPGDHVISMAPKPSPTPIVSRPPQSPLRSPSPQPPPPPPFMSSSGGSGSNYSGSTNPLPPPSPGMALAFAKSTFNYQELAMATDGFSDANLLGQGGFGYVHRGVLPNGKEVAIKRLKAGSGQGEREFQAEVEIISRVHHKHLVSLVGYCMTGAERLLVYEFVPNNTLEFHLHGKGRPTMEFTTRLRIALGAAKGLAYLHEDCNPKIIHRDIKAANILLDFNFEAKVADFGLAKITSEVNTHVSTRVMGTFGYLAPEYASSGKLTDKSDVFSFGIMLLEMVTGRRPVDSAQTFMDDSLVDWARPLLNRALEEGNFDDLVDTRLQKDYNPSEMSRMVACAAACVRHSARRRPRMSQVVRALEGDMSLSDLNEGIRPGHSTVYSSHGSSDYDTMQYNEDMKKFRKMALASEEYASSEVSRPTSEYGLYLSGSSSEGQQTREMEMGKMKKDSRGFSGSSGF
ncbi:proline-rich receptor-like protein kinase PERK1 isoform X2 [Daucus carota subsp. sativus]|uniref:proline-rich receptor-like protein kinase PERK1 isoform X2 n=1 Tax=Daucus carota subsp. sativus TaxID=79200 RepID=UPI0007EF999D|nr:PREDICTED: proline-rich receptor-like protein kinase PERK1 isoform X2 [Daucus carota subsp. sativus]